MRATGTYASPHFTRDTLEAIWSRPPTPSPRLGKGEEPGAPRLHIDAEPIVKARRKHRCEECRALRFADAFNRAIDLCDGCAPEDARKPGRVFKGNANAALARLGVVS